MTKKQQIAFGIISGFIMIIIYLILSLFAFKCPTESQYIALRIIISIGAAAFAIVIPGFIEVKYNNIVTASGAISVFIIIMAINPKPIKSLSDCNTEVTISGNVFLNNKPFEMAEVYLIELDSRKIYTNDNGNFSYKHEGKITCNELTIRIKSSVLEIDTSISVIDYLRPMKFVLLHQNKPFVLDSESNTVRKPDKNSSVSTYRKPEVYMALKDYCIECIAKDSVGRIVNVKNKCNTDSLYLLNYIDGFTRASLEQARTSNCIWKK